MSQYRCLIIEDDPAFADILQTILEKVPEVSVIGVSDNTTEAATKLEKEKPDILLLDVNISGLEGPEIVEVAEHKPKIVVISSHEEGVMENYEIDYVEFIQKPLQSSDQLITAVYSCLSQIS